MSETPIDRFHAYTHTDSFAIRVRNRQIRNVLNELADMAKDLQNIASADLEGGVYPLDRQVIDKHLDNVRMLWRSIRVKRTVKVKHG